MRDVEEIFSSALELEAPGSRAAYLDEACGDDAALRQQVERLLSASPLASRFLESPATAQTDAASAEGPGAVIGPYRLLEAIGEGGMGVVYMAEQESPVRRRVALKIIKPGMDTKQVVVRFEAERQALAMMDHPNIAKVFDGGTTGSGRPYFVMELVRGIPITGYCDREHLAIRERLELFVLACRAVHHAHQKGVIHRDLKPSNVLVTVIDGVPVPKVIDFGVAKAVGEGLTERTLFTAFHQLVGTPLYMSPEQADLSGVDVDTRSDIYSLGVLLYESLTGTTPFDSETLKRAAFDEMRRIIREEEPPRPSTRLSSLGDQLATVSARRKADSRRLVASMKGELDWVVTKALEKDRQRRYQTANDFADDVMKYLTDRPVEACPPSARYRLAKVARRNRAALITTALVALALVAGTGVSLWQAVRATKAEADAEQRASDSRQVVDYLATDVLGAASPQKSRGRTLTVPDLMREADATLGDRFRDQPLVEASVRVALSKTYLVAFWRHAEAEKQAARAASLRERYLGPDHLDTLEALYHQGWAMASDSFNDAARAEAAVPIARRAYVGRRRRLGPTHPDTLFALCALSQAIAYAGRPAEAERLQSEAVALAAANLGPDHIVTLEAGNILGRVVERRGDLPRAEAIFRRNLAEQERVLGPGSEFTWHALYMLAAVVRLRGDSEEWLALSLALVERGTRIFGPNQPAIDTPLGWAIRILHRRGDFAAIRDLCQCLLRELLATPAGIDKDERSRRVSKLNRLVRWLAELPDTVPLDAELAVRAAEEAFAMNHGAGVVLAELYARLGRLDSAAECLAAGIQRSDDDPDALNSIAWFLVTAREPRLRDPARAVVLARKAVELNPKQGGCWGTLGVALYRAGDWDAAIAALNRANELEHDTGLAFNGFFLAMAYHKKGDAARARDWYNRSVAWSAQHKSDGRIRFAQKYHAEAAAVLDVKDQPVSGTRPLEVPTRPE